MKTYKFYTYEALLLNKEHLFDNKNEYVVISLFSRSTGDELLFRQLETNDHFEIFDTIYMDYEIQEKLPYSDSISLAAARAYDTLEHPDETVFVTTRPQDVPIINKYFGEDSIIIIGENNNEIEKN